MKKVKWLQRVCCALLGAALAFTPVLFGCDNGSSDDDDDKKTSGDGPLGDTFEFSGYKWKTNNASAALENGVLVVTPSASGVAIQLADSELAKLYADYPEGFAVTAKIRPVSVASAGDKAFASDGGANIGVVSNVVENGFYGALINYNGRTQLGTYQKAKGLQFGSLLTDSTGTIFKKGIDEPYVIRLEVNKDVLSMYVNGIISDKSGTTTYSVPADAKVARSATAGSYGIVTEYKDPFELYSFKVEALDKGKAAILMTTDEADGYIATLKADAGNKAYVFLNECAYTTRIGNDPITFNVSAVKDDGTEADTVTIANSNDAVATAVLADGVITISPVAKGETVVTVTSASGIVKKIKVTVNIALSYVDTDYGQTAAFYPAFGATDVYEDDHLKITFDDTPVLSKEGFVEIYSADGTRVDKIPFVGADNNVISDGAKEQAYNLQHFMVQIIDEHTLEIIPNCGKLANDTEYYVAIPDEAITGTVNGKAFTGFSGEAKRWKFKTRAAHTPSDPANIVVDMDPANTTADFRTVQGAFKAVSQDATITVKPGVYREILFYTKAYNITLKGDTTEKYGKNVVIRGINCNEYNGSSDTRTMFHWKAAADLTLLNITIENAMDRNTMISGSSAQSEALYFNSSNKLVAYNSSFLGHQDTLLTKGKNWFYKCYIEGDTDFIWGYADVCLLEECELVQLDTSADAKKTSGSYIFETRVSKDDASTPTVGKGYVLFNCEVKSEHPSSYLARRASGKGSAGSNYYDQVAVINTNFTGNLNSALWSVGNEPVYIEKDADGNMHVGWKAYGGTGITPVTDKVYAGTITEALYNAEYSGRNVILNKVYKKEGSKYINASTIWDVSGYGTIFGTTLTADTSTLDEIVTVNGANGAYDISAKAPADAGQNTEIADGTSEDGYVSWTGMKYHSANYGLAVDPGATVTLKLAGDSVITIRSDSNSKGTFGAKDSSNNVVVAEGTSAKTATALGSISFIYKGTATDLTITFADGQNYIGAITVAPWDGEVAEVKSITLNDYEVYVGKTVQLKPVVTTTYLADSSVTYSSETPGVATVDENGIVSGVATGTAKITVTSKINTTISATCTVTVSEGTVTTNTYDFKTADFTKGSSLPSNEDAASVATWSGLTYNSGYGLQTGSNAYVQFDVTGDCKIYVYQSYTKNCKVITLNLYTVTGGTVATTASASAETTDDLDLKTEEDLESNKIEMSYTGGATTLQLSIPGNFYASKIIVDYSGS